MKAGLNNMRTFDIVRRAGRSLRNAKARTVLTSLAIAVGAFTITISLAAGEGVRQYANNLINSNVNPNALFITAEDSSFSNTASQSSLRVYDPGVTSNDGFTIKQLTQADVDKLNNRNDLESVVPIYSPTVEYVTFGNNLTKFVGSVNTYDSTIINEASSGSLPKQGTSLKNGELVVPSGYVEALISEGATCTALAVSIFASFNCANEALAINKAKIDNLIDFILYFFLVILNLSYKTKKLFSWCC
jgi:putative ABC transport system permease protein